MNGHLHTSSGDSTPIVRAALDSERANALELIFDGLSPVPATQTGLWVAVRDEKITAAAWIQRLTENIAAVWPPVSRDDPIAEDLLAQTLKQACAESSFQLFRTLVSSETADRHAANLSSIGLERATTIVSLYSGVEDENAAKRIQSQLSFEPFDVFSESDRMVQLTQGTFEQSLDCPQLTRMTDAGAILDGYIAHPGFTPELWFCLRSTGGVDDDVGILILSDNEEDEQLELVYLGVLPSARGRGYGAAAVDHAKRLAAERGRRRVTLAVDIRNQPALNIYRAAGFTLYAEHELFVLHRQ